jgi:SAM-dependent methyltransferase
MVRRMPSSQAAPQRVRNRFRAKAQQFDDLYEDERLLARWLRPGLFRRRELAEQTVREYDSPAVLDVGCGSGRIGELVLLAGTGRYVGIDFAEPMIELARRRLERFSDRAEVILGDFMEAELERPFDLVLALGLFDYLPDAPRFMRRMFELCLSGCWAMPASTGWRCWLPGGAAFWSGPTAGDRLRPGCSR